MHCSCNITYSIFTGVLLVPCKHLGQEICRSLTACFSSPGCCTCFAGEWCPEKPSATPQKKTHSTDQIKESHNTKTQKRAFIKEFQLKVYVYSSKLIGLNLHFYHSEPCLWVISLYFTFSILAAYMISEKQIYWSVLSSGGHEF